MRKYCWVVRVLCKVTVGVVRVFIMLCESTIDVRALNLG